MKWTQDDQLVDELLSELMEEITDESRQHPSITDLVYCLTKTYIDSTPSKVEPTTKTKMYFTIGLGLERGLLVRRKESKTDGECEGIFYHVDSIDNGELLELKSTRMGPKLTPDTFSESWLKQIKGYCYSLSVTRVKYVVIHLIQAEMQAWQLEFTREELEENWSWLQGRREIWVKARLDGRPPTAFKYNMAWECKECAYKLMCDLMSSLDAKNIQMQEW